jgi:hypothetical protein
VLQSATGPPRSLRDITLRHTSRLTVTNAEFEFLSVFDLVDADPSK